MISKSQQVRNIILQHMSDGQIHTISEIRAWIKDDCPSLAEESIILNNILASLKRSEYEFISIGHGKYQMISPLEYAEQIINESLQDLKGYDEHLASKYEQKMHQKDIEILKRISHNIWELIK